MKVESASFVRGCRFEVRNDACSYCGRFVESWWCTKACVCICLARLESRSSTGDHYFEQEQVHRRFRNDQSSRCTGHHSLGAFFAQRQEAPATNQNLPN